MKRITQLLLIIGIERHRKAIKKLMGKKIKQLTVKLFLYGFVCVSPFSAKIYAAEPVTIRWWGHSMFSVETSRLTIVLDPYGMHLQAYDDPNVKANLVLLSHNHSDHSNVGLVKGNPLVIKGVEGRVQKINAVLDLPAKSATTSLTEITESTQFFSRNAIRIKTIASYHDKEEGGKKGFNAMFLVEVNGLRILHSGDIAQSELTQSQIDNIGRVDVLLVTIGGGSSINAKEALVIVNQLHPRYILPMHYGVKGLRLKLDPLNSFLQILPANFKRVCLKGNTFVIKDKRRRSDNDIRVVILKPRPQINAVGFNFTCQRYARPFYEALAK